MTGLRITAGDGAADLPLSGQRLQNELTCSRPHAILTRLGGEAYRLNQLQERRHDLEPLNTGLISTVRSHLERAPLLEVLDDLLDIRAARSVLVDTAGGRTDQFPCDPIRAV